MAIGKLLPRIALPLRVIRVSADRTFAARSFGHLRRSGLRPDRPGFYSALITPPQPFAEAERKASPNGLSIIRICANCLWRFVTFTCQTGVSGLGRLQPEPGG